MVSFLKNSIILRKRGLSPNQQLRFLKRLYRLLKNGYPLISALTIMKWDKEMERPARAIKESLIRGLTIDEAFSELRFDTTITSYLYFIRVNGDLQTSFEKCIQMFEHRLAYTQKFMRIIKYPILLTAIFIILLIIIKQSILPAFLDLFESNEQTSTIVIHSILLIDYVSTFFIFFILFIGLLIPTWNFIKQRVPIHTKLALYKRIPLYRSFLRIQTTYFFATHMSMFLKTGMPIKEVLTKMAEQTKLPIMAYYSKLMTKELSQGIYFISLLQQLPFIEKQLAQLFQKNSDQHELEKDLTSYSDILAEKIQQRIMKIIMIVQPTFFILLGCFIIFIYGTLMWPMFQLIKTI